MSVKTLKHQDRIRKHNESKQFRQVQYNARVHNIMTHLYGIVEPLCIGLAGTSAMADGSYSNFPKCSTLPQIATQLMQDQTFTSMTRSNIFNNIMRSLGWAIVNLFKAFLDGANTVLNEIYGLFDFTSYTGTESYINELLKFLWIPCAIAFIMLGYILIFNAQKRPDLNKLIQNICIAVIIITGLPALMSTATSIAKDFAVGNQGATDDESNAIIADCLTDYSYLYNWNTQKFDTTKDINAYLGSSGNKKYVTRIDINEQMRYDNQANKDYVNNSYDKWDSHGVVCLLSTVLETDSSGTMTLAHINKPEWLDAIFGDAFYYRYDLDFLTCIITLAAMAIATFFVAFKTVRIIWELAIQKVLAMFFAVYDLSSGDRIKEAIKGIVGSILVIIINSALLKFYMIFATYISDLGRNGQIGSVAKCVALVAVAVAVIDGPNLVEKLLGVDAGLKSVAGTVGAIAGAGIAATHVAKGAAKFGKGTAEFAGDVAQKGAAVGGFVAGGVKAGKEHFSTPKAERKSVKQAQKEEKQAQKAQKATDKTLDKVGTQAQKAENPTIADYCSSAEKVTGTSNATENLNTAQDAYIKQHGESLINEAAQRYDEMAASGQGSEPTEKDALAVAFASKHDGKTKTACNLTEEAGAYQSTNQSVKNKIDNLQQTQSQKGNTVQNARLNRYAQIAHSADVMKQRGNLGNDVTEVQAHTTAAANTNQHSGTPTQTDVFQGNMSTALAHKDEIAEKANVYIDEQKAKGQKITEAQAISHVISNEQDYDMSYGFDKEYAVEAAEVIIAANKAEATEQQVPPDSSSQNRSERSKSISGNHGVNEALGKEKSKYDRPTTAIIQTPKKTVESFRKGYNVLGNHSKKKKKK